jgi:enoyl-CoA hydratase/carnithine racemase
VDHQDIRFEVRDGVAVITLDRPEVRNAFSGRMGIELGEAYRACDTDDDVRAVVLTGTPPAFCAGADMSSGADTFTGGAGQRSAAVFSAAGVDPPAFAIRKPVIAAVNGHAIGIGLTLALQCDLRIVAVDGKYGIRQSRLGMIGDGYSHWTLPRIAGLGSAADILITGRTFDGREASQMGIANRCLPADDVLPTAMEIARDIAENVAPVSAAISKRLLWEAVDRTPEQIERLEALMHLHLFGGPDVREGPVAFLDGRTPQWRQRVSTDWPDWPAV